MPWLSNSFDSCAGPASDHRGSPHEPAPDPARLLDPRWGTATCVTSSNRGSRARRTASLASVLTRSSDGRCNFASIPRGAGPPRPRGVGTARPGMVRHHRRLPRILTDTEPQAPAPPSLPTGQRLAGSAHRRRQFIVEQDRHELAGPGGLTFSGASGDSPRWQVIPRSF